MDSKEYEYGAFFVGFYIGAGVSKKKFSAEVRGETLGRGGFNKAS